jgi:hypothetical protein
MSERGEISNFLNKFLHETRLLQQIIILIHYSCVCCWSLLCMVVPPCVQFCLPNKGRWWVATWRITRQEWVPVLGDSHGMAGPGMVKLIEILEAALC